MSIEGLLGQLDGGPPPLPDGILAAAAAARRPGRAIDVDRPATPVEVLRDRIADFGAAVADLTAEDWLRMAAPYPWTVHQLVAHLAAVEAYVAHLVGLDGYGPPAADEHDHVAMTQPAVDAAATEAQADTVGRWRAVATEVADYLDAAGPDALAHRVLFHGFDLSTSSMLIVRGFELWTHADDIRRATGRAPLDPPPAVLHTMSNLSVSALPFLVPVSEPVTARVVLTGAGGGAWTIGLGGPPAGEPRLEVLAPAADWCRLARRRIEPDRLDATVDGDRTLVERVYAAAQTMAF